MQRRTVLGLFAAAALAGCSESTPSSSSPGPSSAPRSAVPSGSATRPSVPADYRWITAGDDFAKGFSFIWVKDLNTRQVLERLGAKELERVFWHQLVGPGDGQRVTTGQRFFGVARVDTWVLVVEENGTLGVSDTLLNPLSAGTTVVAHYRSAETERLLVLTDGTTDLRLDPRSSAARTGRRAAELSATIAAAGLDTATDADSKTAATFLLTERLTGIAMTRDLLEEKTYLLSTTSD